MSCKFCDFNRKGIEWDIELYELTSYEYDGKKYLLRFVHEDKSDGSVIRITIIGSNESGLEIAFANDSETVINAEFKAVPHDANGTLVIYSETTK